MAVLNRKEEKIQAVLGRLPEKYSKEEFVEAFIKLFSSDWGKLKKAYNKQNQDKEPDAVINMPKPEQYLLQILALYLEKNKPVAKEETAQKNKPAKQVSKLLPKEKVSARRPAKKQE